MVLKYRLQLSRVQLGVVILCIICLTSAPDTARADEAHARAKVFNAEAKRHFNLGKFREAIRYYEKAYQAKPLPVFLYNLGQCHQHLGTLADLKKAVFYFEGYLANQPEASDRKEVEQDIASLKERAARLERQQTKKPVKKPEQGKGKGFLPDTGPPPPKPEPARPSPFYKRWWFWTAVGVAVVGGGLAVGLAVGGRDDRVPGGHPTNFGAWAKD